VTYGAMARQPVQISNAALIFRDLRFRGFWLTKQARHQGRVAMSGVYDQVLSLISSGRLRLPVRSRHGFDSFSAAISEGRKSGGAGKVLFVSPTPGRSI